MDKNMLARSSPNEISSSQILETCPDLVVIAA